MRHAFQNLIIIQSKALMSQYLINSVNRQGLHDDGMSSKSNLEINTIGTKISATIVINVNVYSEDEAFLIVKLQAGFKLETMIRGNKPAK